MFAHQTDVRPTRGLTCDGAPFVVNVLLRARTNDSSKAARVIGASSVRPPRVNDLSIVVLRYSSPRCLKGAVRVFSSSFPDNQGKPRQRTLLACVTEPGPDRRTDIVVAAFVRIRDSSAFFAGKPSWRWKVRRFLLISTCQKLPPHFEALRGSPPPQSSRAQPSRS